MIALLLAAVLEIPQLPLSTDRAKFTERAPMVYEVFGQTESKMIPVPSLPNKIAYVCFKLEGKTVIQCLYFGIGQDAGRVYPIAVLPSEKET